MVTKSNYFLGLSLGLSLLTMGDGVFSSSDVAMLTGAAASSTSFSLGKYDSLLDIFSHTSWCSQLDTCNSFRDMVIITWLLSFHNSPFSFIIFIFVLLSSFQWFFVGSQQWMALFGNWQRGIHREWCYYDIQLAVLHTAVDSCHSSRVSQNLGQVGCGK